MSVVANNEPRTRGQHRALENGGAYDSYSLAWRFLGIYIDCNNNNNDGNQGGNDEASCQRILLWAAYQNKAYRGYGMGEYSIYDWRQRAWDTSTCVLNGNDNNVENNESCTRLDCHLGDSENFELIGVFKELDGLDDWTDQLFKHEAYCVWGEDQNNNNGNDKKQQYGDDDFYYSSSSDYEFMQSFVGEWQSGCKQIENREDENGVVLYVDTMPLQGGNLVYGLYTDDTCQTPLQNDNNDGSSSRLTLYSDYLRRQQQEQGEEMNDNQKQAAALEAAWGRWNDLLNDFKVCQPCRAYSRVQTNEDGQQEQQEDAQYQDDQHEQEEQAQEENQPENRFRRHLEQDEWYNDGGGGDGEGEEEPNGFNCYDDAGYLNCNQCYKFFTKTDLEEASIEDLELAHSQGTILAIVVNGQTYGHGRSVDFYTNTMNDNGIDTVLHVLTTRLVLITLVGVVLMVVLAGWLYNRSNGGRRSENKKPSRRNSGRRSENKKPARHQSYCLAPPSDTENIQTSKRCRRWRLFGRRKKDSKGKGLLG